MSPKLPAVTGRQVIRAAEQLGFTLRHQVGSHAVHGRAAGNGKTIKRNTLRSIIADLRVTPDEFVNLL